MIIFSNIYGRVKRICSPSNETNLLITFVQDQFLINFNEHSNSLRVLLFNSIAFDTQLHGLFVLAEVALAVAGIVCTSQINSSWKANGSVDVN